MPSYLIGYPAHGLVLPRQVAPGEVRPRIYFFNEDATDTTAFTAAWSDDSAHATKYPSWEAAARAMKKHCRPSRWMGIVTLADLPLPAGKVHDARSGKVSVPS